MTRNHSVTSIQQQALHHSFLGFFPISQGSSPFNALPVAVLPADNIELSCAAASDSKDHSKRSSPQPTRPKATTPTICYTQIHFLLILRFRRSYPYPPFLSAASFFVRLWMDNLSLQEVHGSDSAKQRVKRMFIVYCLERSRA